METLRVIGLMSGTSLDGLDICYVEFRFDGGRIDYNIIRADSEGYTDELRNALNTAQNMSALEYARLSSDLGLYIGGAVKRFIDKYGLEGKVDLIASHGQTIFHQPAVKFTAQIGSGAGIAAVTGVDTVCDFRTMDVALGGQGAPLVPIGDSVLFGDYDYCLNLGGFSNISFASGDRRLAYDISPVNYVLNRLAEKEGQPFDRDGKMAASGKVSEVLLQALNDLEFYHTSGPKSLGREWVESEVFPLIEKSGLSPCDALATFTEHIAQQTALNVLGGKVLVTGGGARNRYLIERMRAASPEAEYVVPDGLTIDFKEALIFALLGALYKLNRPNCLASVTGAAFDSVGGCLYRGAKGGINLK